MAASSELDSQRVHTPLPAEGAVASDPGGESCSKERRFRLRKAARLSRDFEFKEAFDAGEGQPARTLVLWVRREADSARRVGVVASKRTFHHAVERNRAKRLMREAFRLQRHRVPPDVDVVLLGRRSILRATRQDVEKDLLRALSRKGVLLAEGPLS